MGIQSSDENALDTIGVGILFGWRRKVTEKDSFNLGLGGFLDRQIRTLGDGIRPNQSLPGTETVLRFKKQSAGGILLMFSATF